MPEVKEKTKKRIGILRGGAGEHYHSSLKKGGDILSYINENLADKYQPIDILVDKDFLWHINGLPVNASDLVNQIDMAWNMAHPSFSNILESLSIPHIGGGGFLETLENNRDMLRNHVKTIGINMTRNIVAPKNAREVFEKFGAPWIVKNSSEVKLIKTFNELSDVIDRGDIVTVEEFIPGKIASVHSVPHFRGQAVYTFPFGNTFGEFTNDEKKIMNVLVRDLCNHLGAKHYLKSDLIVNRRGKIYLLGLQSSPNLKPDSHFSQVCELVGVKPHDVIDHILSQVL